MRASSAVRTAQDDFFPSFFLKFQSIFDVLYHGAPLLISDVIGKLFYIVIQEMGYWIASGENQDGKPD